MNVGSDVLVAYESDYMANRVDAYPYETLKSLRIDVKNCW